MGGITLAFLPATPGVGNRELAPLIALNIDMLKKFMGKPVQPGRGPGVAGSGAPPQIGGSPQGGDIKVILPDR